MKAFRTRQGHRHSPRTSRFLGRARPSEPSLQDAISTISFSCPPVNAVDTAAMREIHTAFTEVGCHTDARFGVTEIN